MSDILDRLADVLESRKGGDPADSYVSRLFSRGEDAILKKIGEEATEALVNWNQRIPDLTLRADARPPYAEETAWEGYFKLGRARFGEALPDLESGKVYMQDPFTGIPVKLLGVHPGESVADLCAAPGGKTRLLAEALGGQGVLLALDKPGRRVDRLKENLLRSGMSWVKVISAVLESSGPATGGGITGGKPVDAVLIDVPCSNTGVIQKRPDVKLRLSESGVSELSLQQLRLLEAASGWVRPGGRLVYSTCSIEEEENQGVIDCFLKEHPEWQLMESVMSYPWVCQHDGGGAFLLTNRAPQ